MEQSNFTSSPLTLIVNGDVKLLENFSPYLSHDWPVVAVGKELSAFLISSVEVDRAWAARRWLEDEVRAKNSEAVVFRDIDLLFLPILKLDPLAFLRQLSRYQQLIVLWPGNYQGKVLSYAQPEHSHYKFWKNLNGIKIMGVNNAL